VASPLKPLTALGRDIPQSIEIGSCKIVERFDVALASVAARRGHESDLANAAKVLGIPLPDAGQSASEAIYSSFWVSSDMWFVEAPFDSHEDIVSHLKPALGDHASITEQTDAWVAFDISAPQITTLFERLSNLDLAILAAGTASRTMIEHLGCYLVKRSQTEIRLYGPRSSAKSLFHALEVAAKSVT